MSLFDFLILEKSTQNCIIPSFGHLLVAKQPEESLKNQSNNNSIVKILNHYIILSCTHLPLLSSIYPFQAMHSLLVTIIYENLLDYDTNCEMTLPKW